MNTEKKPGSAFTAMLNASMLERMLGLAWPLFGTEATDRFWPICEVTNFCASAEPSSV
jgi:hypothetical protein